MPEWTVWSLGGLPDEEYDTFAGMLNSKSMTLSDFEEILKVRGVKLIADNDIEHDYKISSFTNRAGYAVLKLECDLSPEQVGAIGRRNRMEISFRSFIHRRHQSYTFFATRTVLTRLQLDLIAPFEVHATPFHWWHAFEKVEDPIGNGEHKSAIELAGPVPGGTYITWVFSEKK